MTTLLTGEANIGFMGSESTIYTYAGGNEGYAVNFAQLTQRAGNFLVSREPADNFRWEFLKGSTVLGGRAAKNHVNVAAKRTRLENIMVWRNWAEKILKMG